MKRMIFLLSMLLASTAASPAQYETHGGAAVSFDVFYSSLSSYGEWIPVEGGIYGWHPIGVAAGWRPYMYGRWAWTSDGWYWVSDEPWGWATFHYGRWYYDDYYGWIWIPGYDWAPAWVEWRYGGPYVGWAPLCPYAIFQIGIGIHYSRHWVTPYPYWTFVDSRYVTSPSLHRYVYRTENNSRYFGLTRGAGDVRYNNGRIVSRGPDRQYIEQRGNVRITEARIVDVRDRGQDRVINRSGREVIEVYRPRVQAQTRVEMSERPSRVRDDGRTLTLDAPHTDLEVRRATVETERGVSRSVEARQQIERAPAAQPADAPKIERRQDQTRAVEPQNPRQRIERAPAAEPKAAPKIERRQEQTQAPAQQNIQQRRAPAERSQARPAQRVAPAQREKVQKEQPRTQNPGRVMQRPEVKREGRAAEPQRGGGRSESGRRDGKRER